MEFQWNSIPEAVFAHAARQPDAEAIRAGGQSLSWDQLARAVDGATAFLADLDVTEDEPVGLMLANSVEHVILWLGLMRMGATPVEIPPDMPQGSLAPLLRSLGAGLMLVEPQIRVSAAARTVPIAAHWRPPVGAGKPCRTSRPADELRMFALSSGSTGAPRAVVASQGARLNRVRLRNQVLARWWSPERPGTLVLTNTLANAGFSQATIHQLALGGRTVLLPQFAQLGDLVRAVAEWDDAIILAVPNTCRLLLQSAPAEGLLLPRARLLRNIGLPLFAHEKRAIIHRVTPYLSDEIGTSGCGIIAALTPDEMEAKADSVGRPVPGIEIRVVDDLGDARPAGDVGHIHIRSPGMAKRAFQGQGGTDVVEGFVDGWFRTGDMGRLDADGFLYLSGRASERIRQAGADVFPNEIEAVLLSHPEVREAVVVGVVPPGGGEVAVAVVSGTAQFPALAALCEARLPAERRPRSIVFTEGALPILASGKIDRAAIKAHLAKSAVSGKPG